MERPASIVWFERCYLAVLAIGLINFVVQWPTMMAKLAENPGAQQLGPNFASTVALVTIAISTVISLLLWFFAARKRSTVAKWIVTIFFVISLLTLGFSAMTGAFPAGIAGVTSVVTLVLNAIAVWNLFRPDAEAWFAGNPAVDSAPGL